MLSRQTQLVLAGVLAVGGSVVAWRALDRARPPTIAVAAPQSGPKVAAILTADFDTTPTPDTIQVVTAASATRAVEVARSMPLSPVFQHDRLADLGNAFSERLESTISGDFDRAQALLRARGYKGTDDRKTWQSTMAGTHVAPFDLKRLEVRILYIHGNKQPAADDHLQQGFSTLTLAPTEGLLPVPSDAKKGALDIVEVRIPMRKPAMDGRDDTVLTGYQFAWCPARSQWIPWRNVIYKSPAQIHTALLF